MLMKTEREISPIVVIVTGSPTSREKPSGDGDFLQKVYFQMRTLRIGFFGV